MDWKTVQPLGYLGLPDLTPRTSTVEVISRNASGQRKATILMDLESQNQTGNRRNMSSAAGTVLRLAEATRALNVVTEVRARQTDNSVMQDFASPVLRLIRRIFKIPITIDVSLLSIMRLALHCYLHKPHHSL
jgi:hypothetical protein